MTMKRAIALASALAIGVWLAFGGKAASSNGGEAAPRVAACGRGPVRAAVTATGRVVSNRDVDIKCKASGLVVRLPWEVSDRVDTGELLLELDPVDEVRRVRLAEAAVAAAEARLAQARSVVAAARIRLASEERRVKVELESATVNARAAAAKAERARKLLAARVGSEEAAEAAASQAAQAEVERTRSELAVKEIEAKREDLAARESDVALAETQLAKDRISLDEARTRLVETKVFAPIAGVVVAKPVEIGQIVSSGVNNVGGGTSVLTLSDLSRLFVLAAVDEANIGRVAVGMEARVKVDAHPGRRFRGRVTRIAPRGRDVSNVVTFEVRVEVTDGDLSLLKPEMSADVEIVSEEKPDVLRVPAAAVRRRGGRASVTLESGETREVELGLADDEFVEVAKGLAEGERVRLPEVDADARWKRPERGGPPFMGPMGGGRRR